MIYKLDLNTLTYKKDKKKLRFIGGSLLLVVVGSFILGRYIQSSTLDNFEIKILEYQRQEQLLSQDKIINLLKKHNVRYPYIALAQAYVETNLGRTGVGVPNKNLFGMRPAKQRSTLSVGEENGFAVFDNWKESVLDYTLWQDAVFGVNSNISEEQYYTVLDQIYCQGNNTYSQSVKKIINKYNLKSKF